MERMGPIRPNVINRWTLFQAKEHPDQYDLDDGIVVVKGDDDKAKKKPNLRNSEGKVLYSDSIVVHMGDKPNKTVEVAPVIEKKSSQYTPPVRVDLFMESLCPDTHYFVKSALSKVAHDPAIMAITDLHMYIFGKGEQLSQEPQKFRCQHGPAECYGNLVENCIVKHSNSGDAVDIMMCLHQKRNFDEASLTSCTHAIEDGKTIKRAVMQCIQGEGKYLLQKAYDKTPRSLGYVPSMRINKGPITAATVNLKDVICKSYSGEKPLSCP